MSRACDLCEQPVAPGEPRYAIPGDGGASGAPAGFDRHWECHKVKFGVPHREWGAPKREVEALPPARAVLAPKVRKGPYNQSQNARREFSVLRKERAIGKTRVYIECPFCFARFWAYVWSISGGGKKCPNCGAIHASFGMAYPIEGNEDLAP